MGFPKRQTRMWITGDENERAIKTIWQTYFQSCATPFTTRLFQAQWLR
jgi:hypothetical protein